MADDAAEILARIDRREREQEEDMKLLAEKSVEAARQIKKQLDGLARTTGKDVLEILGYDRETVMKWANSQKEPLFESDEEKEEFEQFLKPFKGKIKEFKFINDKDKIETAKISDRGVVKAALVKAWRENPDLKPL